MRMGTKDDDDLDKAEVGRRLRLTREALRMSQKEFCEAASIAPNTYNQFEQGHRLPSVGKAARLCAAHNLTLDWIYLGDDGNLAAKLSRSISALREMDQS
jgi:transcriptional regulator with XRE-family HTH domain